MKKIKHGYTTVKADLSTEPDVVLSRDEVLMLAAMDALIEVLASRYGVFSAGHGTAQEAYDLLQEEMIAHAGSKPGRMLSLNTI